MERRSFLRKAGAGVVAGAAVGLAACGKKEESAPAAAAAAAAPAVPAAPAVHVGPPEVKWRITSSYPKSLDTIHASTDLMMQRLRELTDGKFDVRVFPAGEIVPGLQALDAVQQGSVEACHTSSYYYVGKDKTFAFGCTMPFGLNARQMTAWVLNGGGQELLDEFYANYNVVSFMGGNTGAQMGGWFRKPIASLDDVKGMKMRIAGLGGEVLARMGAVPQQIAAGDIYASLEKGTIDAAEWIAPYDDEKLGFYKVAPYYYYPGWWEPGAMIHFFVNKDAWAKLPKAYQIAFRVASQEVHNGILAAYDDKNPLALARLLTNGVKLQSFSKEILQRAHKVTFDMYNEEAAKNPAWAKIFAAWDKYRKSANAWFSVAETPLDAFMQSAR
ncbi:MAG: TRAP transporter substrate-binding protein DctP [Thauera sp.]|nr:TRAP transporter substrate-binding protein DctP [Thauera sp.]